jgi:hypothetical protein
MSELDEEEPTPVEDQRGPPKIHKFHEVRDFVWVHPDPAYTTAHPLWLVDVPSDEKDGKPMLHLILKSLAQQYLDPKEVVRLNLALASTPKSRLFLGIVPCRNLDNSFNASMLTAVGAAKQGWRKILRVQDREAYYPKPPHDADFAPAPEWPSTPLMDLIEAHFRPHKIITTADHPGLLRILGARQQI